MRPRRTSGADKDGGRCINITYEKLCIYLVILFPILQQMNAMTLHIIELTKLLTEININMLYNHRFKTILGFRSPGQIPSLLSPADPDGTF